MLKIARVLRQACPELRPEVASLDSGGPAEGLSTNGAQQVRNLPTPFALRLSKGFFSSLLVLKHELIRGRSYSDTA